jgi:hypothetical protein
MLLAREGAASRPVDSAARHGMEATEKVAALKWRWEANMKSWNVLQNNGKLADLERDFERREVRRPAKMTVRDLQIS